MRDKNHVRRLDVVWTARRTGVAGEEGVYQYSVTGRDNLIGRHSQEPHPRCHLGGILAARYADEIPPHGIQSPPEEPGARRCRLSVPPVYIHRYAPEEREL